MVAIFIEAANFFLYINSVVLYQLSYPILIRNRIRTCAYVVTLTN